MNTAKQIGNFTVVVSRERYFIVTENAVLIDVAIERVYSKKRANKAKHTENAYSKLNKGSQINDTVP